MVNVVTPSAENLVDDDQIEAVKPSSLIIRNWRSPAGRRPISARSNGSTGYFSDEMLLTRANCPAAMAAAGISGKAVVALAGACRGIDHAKGRTDLRIDRVRQS